MKSYYKIVLVKSESVCKAQEIPFYTSLTMANKVFNALSFALNGSDYKRVIMTVGKNKPIIINSAKLHGGAKNGL